MKKSLSILMAVMMLLTAAITPYSAYAKLMINQINLKAEDFGTVGIGESCDDYDFEDASGFEMGYDYSISDYGWLKKSDGKYKAYTKTEFGTGTYSYFIHVCPGEATTFEDLVVKVNGKKWTYVNEKNEDGILTFRSPDITAKAKIERVVVGDNDYTYYVQLGNKIKKPSVSVTGLTSDTDSKLPKSLAKISDVYFIKGAGSKFYKKAKTKDTRFAGKYSLVIVVQTKENATFNKPYMEFETDGVTTYSDYSHKISKNKYAFAFTIWADTREKNGVSYTLNKNHLSTSFTGTKAAKKIKLLSKIKCGKKTYKVTEILDYGFNSVSSEKIIIPKTVTKICYASFSHCPNLTSVNIPKSVKSIGKGAFANCASLKSIKVEKGNKKYVSVDGVLYNKKKTVLIQYPANKKDKSFTIPSGVKTISLSAFEGCQNLTEVKIPKSVEYIEVKAFNECPKLKSIVFEKGSALKQVDALAFGLVNYDELTGVTVSYYDNNVNKIIKQYNKDTSYIKSNIVKLKKLK